MNSRHASAPGLQVRAFFVAILGAVTVGAAIPGAAIPAGAAASDDTAPVITLEEGAVADRYVVVLEAGPADAGGAAGARGAADPVLERAENLGVDIDQRYLHALNGFAAELDEDQLEALRADPGVAYIAQDGIARASAVQAGPPSWGLDRIDQAALPLNQAYGYDATGAGVTAYVIDTGIRTSHQDFSGRARVGFDGYQDGLGSGDCNGHGTHVAGTIGGETYGVAKDVELVSVRVLDCNGWGLWSTIIQGVDWVTAHHSGPSVANMSLTGGWYTPVDDAVAASIASGVTYVLAAGNDNGNACDSSPARTPSAITVGATTITDVRAGISNWGSCLDLFAPGSGIVSSSNVSNTANTSMSGTSMAAPHVAGAAALYLGKNPGATPSAVASALLRASVPNVVTSAGSGSPNRLLQTGFGTTSPTTTTTTTSPTTTTTSPVKTTTTTSPVKTTTTTSPVKTTTTTAPVTTTTSPVVRGALKAQLANRDYNPTDSTIQPWLRVVNTGSSPVQLSRVTLRYWFSKDDGAGSFGTACDHTPLGCGNVTTAVKTPAQPKAGADRYLEVGFASSAGSLAASTATGDLQLRLNKSDWSPFSETDDYSYLSPDWQPADTTKVAVYLDGTLVAGTEP